MVRVNCTFSIDHELKAEYQKLMGKGNTSDDLEEYIKFKLREQNEKLQNISNTNNSAVNISNSHLQTVQKEQLKLDLLNNSKTELSQALNAIDKIATLAMIRANAHVVDDVARTRINKLKKNG